MFPDSLVHAAQRHPLAAITASRAVTEICSATVFMGAAHVLDHKVEFKPLKRAFAKLLEPLVPTLDAGMDHLPALETASETDKRHTSSAADKAYIFADSVIDNGIRCGLSLAAQMVLMKCFDHQLGLKMPESAGTGVTDPYLRAAVWDHTLQIGSAIMINTVFSRKNEQMQTALEKIIHQWGVKRSDAAAIARDAICIIAPNIAGAFAGIASLYHAHGFQKT
jgi:hypothetical protein